MSHTTHFADRLCDAIASKGNPVVVGLDPRLESLPAFLLKACYTTYGRTATAVSQALWLFNRTIIDAVHDLVPAVKPQLACYERYGVAGLQAYASTVQYAQAAGLVVIADAKRNDIGSTATLYAEAFLGASADSDAEAPGDFAADALTVNGYLGQDGIQPFLERAAPRGRGLFVLVKTSNPSAGDIQDLLADGRPLYEHMGGLVESWGQTARGVCGYSAVGAVVGATYPEQGRRLRALMPHTFFLVPGYGAQGASAADVVGCFDARGQGALINASRSILFAYQTSPYADRYGAAGYGMAARAATLAMCEEIRQALGG
jgi:orotidine-5'-phosphate decarboxylase